MWCHLSAFMFCVMHIGFFSIAIVIFQISCDSFCLHQQQQCTNCHSLVERFSTHICEKEHPQCGNTCLSLAAPAGPSPIFLWCSGISTGCEPKRVRLNWKLIVTNLLVQSLISLLIVGSLPVVPRPKFSLSVPLHTPPSIGFFSLLVQSGTLNS